MGGANVRSTGHRYRRARRLRENRRGLVAVVGTLLALLVFFALFGIFLTQYVPLWMTDNESQFTSQAAASFADFKEAVDSQYILGGPQTIGTAFTISSQGVPLLAQPTEGSLAFLPTNCPNGFYVKGQTGATPANIGQPVTPAFCVFENITFNYGPGATSASPNYYSQHVPSGVLEMVLPNRYFNAQTFYFEDDALVQSQGGLQQVMALPPPLNVATAGSNTTVTTSFLQLYGNTSAVIGQGSEQVFSQLRYAQSVSSTGKLVNGRSLLNVTFEIGTQYPCAWQSQLMSTMNVSGVPYHTGPATGTFAYPFTYYNWTNPTTSSTQTIPVAPSACTSLNGATTVLSLKLTDVDFATVFYAGIQVVVGIGGT
jgi:hypothetical protein